MKIALAMIVKGDEKEAVELDRCLHYAADAVDKVFITITHLPGEERNKAVEKIAQSYGAEISDYEWKKDFADARNFNFSQVPKEYDYILWLDADDALKDAGEEDMTGSRLKDIIKKHTDVDAFVMFYLYAFDERKNSSVVHRKTRVVRNDGSFTWIGNGIHEELSANRQISQFDIKGIEVVHMTTPERLEQSAKRNYDIAKSWLTSHSENPTAWFNLGNSAFSVGAYDESVDAFNAFIEKSQSDDEKYIARLRRSDVYYVQGKHQLALDEVRYAIGMKPEFPDAYHAAGKIYYQMGQYEKAKDMFLNGLGRPAPYYQIIVYNPREYDYVPLMNLAKAYYALNLPQLALPALEAAVKIVPADKDLQNIIKILKEESKEGDKILKIAAKLRKITDKKKLKKELDKVPEKFKFHPEILRIRNTNFIKETSTGKDLVIFCGYTAEEWTPETIAKKGSGGSEEAAITLAEGLSKAGWNVTVYNNCGTEESVHGRVTYKPYMSWNYRDKQDVTILWRQTKPLDWEINSTKVYVDMHDVIPKGEFTEARIEKLDKVFFKSNWHRSLYPQIPDEKTIVIPNGIHPEAFTPNEGHAKDPNLLINTASPVRSLTALIDIMKEVRKEVPEAKMHWAYGWVTTDAGLQSNPNYKAWKDKVLQGMEEVGIVDLGRLTHAEVAELYNKASYYVYPTGFPEIDCISITKALAAGAYPITTDYGAIKEKAGHGGVFISYDESYEKPDIDFAIESEEVKQKFVKEIVSKLKNPPTDDERYDMWKFAVDTYSWDSVIQKWITEISNGI